MKKPKYHHLITLVNMIDAPNANAIQRFLSEARNDVYDARGSTNNHQTWRGGWWDHTTEAMNIAVVLYPILDALRPLPFTLSDALLVLFMHDVEKPWKYEMRNGEWVHRIDMIMKSEHQAYRMKLADRWGVKLTEEHINGIKYAEGEVDDYTPHERVMQPLAAFAHMCDNWSARGWFDHPLENDDPWIGARRIASASNPVVRSGARIAPDGVDEEEYLEKLKLNVEQMVDDVISASMMNPKRRDHIFRKK